jgi:hypothetical protein
MYPIGGAIGQIYRARADALLASAGRDALRAWHAELAAIDNVRRVGTREGSIVDAP